MNQFLIFFAFFRWTKGSACLALRVRFVLAFPHLKKVGHFRPGARCISVLFHCRPTTENNYGMSLWNSTFFLRKKPPARQKLFFSVVKLKGVMILDCVYMCLEMDHVIKMCTNMAGIYSVTSITWKRSIDEKCPNFFLRLYFRTRGTLISKFRVENLGHFETPTTKTVILTFCENNLYQITYLPKNYLWTKNEGNRFFNSCHSMLHISWPSLLKLYCR